MLIRSDGWIASASRSVLPSLSMELSGSWPMMKTTFRLGIQVSPISTPVMRFYQELESCLEQEVTDFRDALFVLEKGTQEHKVTREWLPIQVRITCDHRTT